MATYREERIRQLAHEIWEREGHPHGRDAEHWRMATEAYEAEMFSSRFDDAGQPMEAGLQAPQEGVMRAPTVASPNRAAVTQPVTSQAARARKRRTKAEMEATRAAEAAAPKAHRGRKPQEEAAPLVAESTPATKRKRRTKAEMAAAAAGVAGAAAAVVATVAVAKRRRGAKAETAGEAAPAPAANAALRRPRGRKAGTKLSDAEPAPVGMASHAATGAVPDPSADGSSDVATGAVPDPGAEPPSDAAFETSPQNAPSRGSLR